MRPRSPLALTLVVLAALAACGSPDGADPATSSATTTPGQAAATATATPSGGASASITKATTVEEGLAAHGLAGRSVVEVIDALDRTNADRESGLGASVRMHELVLTAGSDTTSMPMPADKTYLSIAPYRTRTHDCYAHHLSGCQGEQVGEDFEVTITDAAGKRLYSGTQTTYDNGFFGVWLPRDVTGTITVTGGDATGSIPFGTRTSDPTCLTTLRLA